MNGYITAKALATKWNMSARTIQSLCSGGKLKGAMKFGNAWAIPEDVERPYDGRVISGAYRNWRKKSNTNKKIRLL